MALVVRALQGIRLPGGSFKVWRFARIGHNPLDTVGSRLTSGRWHNCETTAALYTSLEYETALAEYRTRKRDPFPARAVSFRVTVGHVLDLVDPDVIARLPFPFDRCLQDNLFSLRRGAIVGDAAVALNASALYAPCMRGPAPCLCLYVIHQHDYSIESPRHFVVVDPLTPPELIDPA